MVPSMRQMVTSLQEAPLVSSRTLLHATTAIVKALLLADVAILARVRPSPSWLLGTTSPSPGNPARGKGALSSSTKKKKRTPSTSTAMKDTQELASAHHTRYICDLSAVTGLSMTIFVTWQLSVTLDRIRNSCDVFKVKCSRGQTS